jgi:polygalacturonase
MTDDGSRHEFSRRDFLAAAGMVTGGAVVSGLAPWQQGPAAAAGPWDQVPVILGRIKPPTFPDRTFDLTAHGGRAGGSADNTEAFRRAIAACNAAGGGHVVVPRGVFLTGAVHLLSNVDLHLADGATIRFDSNRSKYPQVFTRWQGIECYNYSPFIYAYKQTNIAVTGNGTLDGQGDTWKPLGGGGSDWTKLQRWGADNTPLSERRLGTSSRLRPNMVQFHTCTNILVEGITLVKSPMWTVHPVLSRNVTVRNVTLNTRNGGGNNDGVDPECSSDVHITGCTFNTGDDCIAIKSGRDVDGRRVNVPSENIVIENCTFVFSNRGGICIGSEASGGARNIFARDSRVNPANTTDALWYALFVKTSRYRGGTIDGVHLRNISVNKVAKSPVFVTLNYSGSGNSGPQVNPTVRNIEVDGMTVRGGKAYAVEIDGLSASRVRGVRVLNSSFNGIARGANRLVNTADVTFTNTTINGRPVGSGG